MKKFQLLVIALTIGISGSVHAGTPLKQIESKSVARESDVIGDAMTGTFSNTAHFSSNASEPQAQQFNFIKFDVPNYFESRRVSHVPEPEGWAMMLMGVGFVVYQVRRRKRAREAWDIR